MAKKKKKKSSEDILRELCSILVDTQGEFSNNPEFYRAGTIRTIMYLIKHRPEYLPGDWK